MLRSAACPDDFIINGTTFFISSTISQYFYLLPECSAATTAEVRKEMASRTWEESYKAKGVKWGKVL